MLTSTLVKNIEAGNIHRKVTNEVYDGGIVESFKVLSLEGIIDTSNIAFEPEKHLTYYALPEGRGKFESTRRLTMKELGLEHPHQISDIGVTDPFPLFTDEAIRIMRQEILNKELFMKYARFNNSSTTGQDCILRGYAKNGDQIDAPFTYQAWTHPKSVELLNKMAGVDLVTAMDYEIAHVNIGVKDPKEANQEIIRQSRQKALKGDSNGDDIPAIVGWHRDAYPFVCVLMLSDTTNMIGGETSLRMGGKNAGKVSVVPGPKRGYATILQGGLIEHIAPSPVGVSERITMVTSYRAKDPLKKDISQLGTVKPEVNFGSRYNDFYPQWIDYRSDVMQKRLEHLKQNCKKNGRFDKEFCNQFLKDIEEYARSTRESMQVSEQEWRDAAKNTTPTAKL